MLADGMEQSIEDSTGDKPVDDTRTCNEDTCDD
jgi:hypothetical protein